MIRIGVVFFGLIFLILSLSFSAEDKFGKQAVKCLRQDEDIPYAVFHEKDAFYIVAENGLASISMEDAKKQGCLSDSFTREDLGNTDLKIPNIEFMEPTSSKRRMTYIAYPDHKLDSLASNSEWKERYYNFGEHSAICMWPALKHFSSSDRKLILSAMNKRVEAATEAYNEFKKNRAVASETVHWEQESTIARLRNCRSNDSELISKIDKLISAIRPETPSIADNNDEKDEARP